MNSFKELDPLLHSQLRLAVMSLLIAIEEADFNYLKNKTDASAGNLSIQLEKLNEAGYITIKKSFVGKRPKTTCKVSNAGRKAFKAYVDALQLYLNV